LTKKLEAMLTRNFNYQAIVVVRSETQLRGVVDKAPPGFGKEPGKYLSDVVFLRAPLTPARALREISIREGVDEVFGGTGVLYFSRLARRASQSRMGRVASLPIYQDMTIRSWSSTTKLLKFMDDL
jgi:uncharacterized protein (DUF1697 family)